MHQSSTYASCLSYQAEVMFSAAQHRLLCAPYLFFMLYFDSAFNFAIIRSSIAMKDAAAVGLVSTLFVNGGKVVKIVLLRALLSCVNA